MLKVVIDAGHGYSTPGKRSPDGMKEYEFNRAVANAMKAELEKYEGVAVTFTHSDSRDVPLKERTDKANAIKADVFFSIHANAFRGVMGSHGGIETFVCSSRPKEATALAKQIQQALVKEAGLQDRGVKFASYHVLRETHMTAVLIEHGFMDSTTDLPKLKSDAYRKLCGQTNAKTLASFYGLKRKPEPKPTTSGTTFFRVVTGSFSSRQNANSRISALKKAGFESFIDVFKKDGKTFYRVVTGSFGDRDNAEQRMAALKKAGFDSFIDVYKK